MKAIVVLFSVFALIVSGNEFAFSQENNAVFTDKYSKEISYREKLVRKAINKSDCFKNIPKDSIRLFEIYSFSYNNPLIKEDYEERRFKEKIFPCFVKNWIDPYLGFLSKEHIDGRTIVYNREANIYKSVHNRYCYCFSSSDKYYSYIVEESKKLGIPYLINLPQSTIYTYIGLGSNGKYYVFYLNEDDEYSIYFLDDFIENYTDKLISPTEGRRFAF